MSAKLTHEKFVQKARRVHGDKYNYDFTRYVHSKENIEIICPKHGLFNQRPSGHLSGKGCPSCAKASKSIKFRLSTKQFVKMAKLLHGNKYRYNIVNYTNCETKVKIICPTHGQFAQRPYSHIGGQGCPKCAKYLTRKDFIEKAIKAHGNRYVYAKAVYVNSAKLITIICRKHGEFYQPPSKHIKGHGCPTCAREATSALNSYSKRKFTKIASVRHDGKYKYDAVKYVNSRTMVDITCPLHGTFSQTPKSHLRGAGCPKCCRTISKIETLWLNKMGIPNDVRNRHVTLRSNNKRYVVDALVDTKTIYEFYGDYWHGNPSIYQRNDINRACKKTFGYLYDKTMRRERELNAIGYNVITKWESDFKKELASDT